MGAAARPRLGELSPAISASRGHARRCDFLLPHCCESLGVDRRPRQSILMVCGNAFSFECADTLRHPGSSGCLE